MWLVSYPVYRGTPLKGRCVKVVVSPGIPGVTRFGASTHAASPPVYRGFEWKKSNESSGTPGDSTSTAAVSVVFAYRDFGHEIDRREGAIAVRST